MLGVEYMKGDQVEKDLDKAIEWWKKQPRRTMRRLNTS